MLKHLLAIIVLSAAAIFAIPHCHSCLQWLLGLHTFIVNTLGNVFAVSSTGNFIKSFIAILVIPVSAGIILGGAYWVFKRRQMPYLMNIVWSIWIVLIVTLILLHK